MAFSWIRQRILLTGSHGFLGSNMFAILKDYIRGRSMECLISRPSHAGYDLTKEADVDAVYQQCRPTVVIHMAGLVGGIGANLARPADFFYDNLMMGTLLMQHALGYGVEKFIAIGAGCGYPEHAPIPTKETDLWTGYPQAPSAPYSLAKKMMVVQAEALYRQHGFQSVVIMPGNLFGIHDYFNLERGHVIPCLVRKFVEAVKFGQSSVTVWGTGKATRDFIYASDVCEGLIRVSEAFDTPEVVNLSSGVETSIAEVVELLIRITGYNGAVVFDATKPDGQMRRCFDSSKARSVGWEPKTGLADGLEATVRWFKDNYETARK